MATKGALETNTHTKETLATIGDLKGGFDRKAFGHARFGEAYGRERTKEALQTNTHTKEAVESM